MGLDWYNRVQEIAAPQSEVKPTSIWMQDTPIICKYEKRKGKPITIIEGYTLIEVCAFEQQSL